MLRERVDKMGAVLIRNNSWLEYFKDRFDWYFKEFGPPPLFAKERKGLEQLQEKLRTMSDKECTDDEWFEGDTK